MARLCENDHEVREGMFYCPACGSEDVADRRPGQAPVLTAEARAQSRRRERAEQRLREFVNRGLVLLVAGVVAVLVSVVLAADGNGGGYGFFALAAWVLGIAGAASLLCGIVGWGVKYGIEATERE